jgi:hypothetical protein
MATYRHSPPRLARVTFFIAVTPLVLGVIEFWICAVAGWPYHGYDETLVGLPCLYCALVATPLAFVCICTDRNPWSRLAVVAVIADWFLLLPMAM